MDTLCIRVTAPFGHPQDLSGVPTVERSEVFANVEGAINDPCEPEQDDGVDALLDDFQIQHRCKVSYPAAGNGSIREFEIFEPTYFDVDSAHNAASELLKRLTDYVQGLPRAN